jgi:hypothetical protein
LQKKHIMPFKFKNFMENLERAKGFEPSTSTLARLRSTPELRPLSYDSISVCELRYLGIVTEYTYRIINFILYYIFLYMQGKKNHLNGFLIHLKKGFMDDFLTNSPFVSFSIKIVL